MKIKKLFTRRPRRFKVLDEKGLAKLLRQMDFLREVKASLFSFLNTGLEADQEDFIIESGLEQARGIC